MQVFKKLRFINSNSLKIIAAVLMVIDHVGLLFFPTKSIFRAIGRLSMPLFAFAIAEGCRYTKNKAKHLFLIAALALICQIVYFLYDKSLYMSILVTFTFSILNIYALQSAKKQLFIAKNTPKTVVFSLLFFMSVFATFVFCKEFKVDYGFWGCMLPVFASVFDFRGIECPEKLKKLDCIPVRALTMAIGILLLVSTQSTSYRFWALLAVPILLLYNGEKGRLRLKYFFYLFYPLHLVLLQGLDLLL